jgi:hypothetical protein
MVAGLALTVPLGACNNGSEGQPCDTNDDCQGPLLCLSTTTGGLRCCPPATQSSTTQICGAAHPGVMGSNPPPVTGSDSGPADAGASPAAEASVPDGSDGAPE